jgi:hypothetical protein
MHYTKDDFIEEFFLRLEDKEFAAEWAWRLVSKADNIIQDYEKKLSWPSPEASEIIGEVRERRYILKFLNELLESGEFPLCAAAYKDIINSINNCEHHG